MFQLSVELYDTKDKKVVWSDRWQEKWDNLPSIKGSLSDGLLKALDTKPKVEKKAATTNTEAYEFYLKAKYKYEKRENMEDTDIARGLLRKSIKIDENLLIAKNVLAKTYYHTGDYDKSMEIDLENIKKADEIGDKNIKGKSLHNIGLVYSDKGDHDKALDYYKNSLKISEEIGNRRVMGYSLGNIGDVYRNKGDYEKGLDYYERSHTIRKEIGDKREIGYSFNNIGNLYYEKGDYEKALEYFSRSLVIQKEIGNKYGIGYSLNNLGLVYYDKGGYEKALEYYERSLSIQEEIGNKLGIGFSLYNIGLVYGNKVDFQKAEEYLDKSLAIQKEIGLKLIELATTTYLYLAYKNLGKQFDINEIYRLIKETENIEFELNYRLYQLLEDKAYLKSAYNQVQEKADNLEDGAKFLSYPIPKAIVEEWEKVK